MISVTQWLGLARQANRLYWDASYVIATRSRHFAQGRMTSDEWQDMCTEKPAAFLSAVRSGHSEMMRGGSVACVARSTMRPIGHQAGLNARRLRGGD